MHGEGFLLHGLVEDATEAWPDALAVATPHRTLSFAELDQLANQVAASLLTERAPRGIPVGVRLSKGWEQVVAVLGVLKAGLPYLPLEPDLPPHRLAQLVELAGCRHVLTGDDVAVPPARVHLMSEVLQGEPPAARVKPVVDPHDLAYVLFTSGSTGTPKGVLVEHASAANTILDLNGRFRVGPGDALLGVSSFSFDPSVYDIFGILGAGATLVLPDPDLARDPAHWASLMTDRGVTLWMSVPALLSMLVSWHEESGAEPRIPLRVAFLGGEVLPLDLPDRVRTVFPSVELVNVYGPTETSICSTWYPVRAVDPQWTRIPCGKPLSGQRILILDEQQQPVPDGGTGEICIAGAGLARGYLGDEEQTRLSFVRQPGTGVRLYRTGDRGRWLPDGNLDFLGRVDDQVKLRGYRIELGEIEAALTRTGRVEHSAVVLTPAGLAGFVIGSGPIDATAVRADVAALLPRYMIPDSLTVLDRLPLTSNGKVDRDALASLAVADGPVSARTQPPRPGLEQRMAEIIADLLQRPLPDRTDSFWELGGNSLVAAQLAARLRRLFQVDVPIGFALTHPTVAEMADAMTALPRMPDALPAVVRRAAADVPAPLSHGQEQVWFLDQLVGGNRAYHAQCTIRFAGDLDAELLRRALTEVVRRHEILRTTFRDDGDGPVQVVHAPAPVALPVTDLRNLPSAQRETALEQCIRREADRSFDLGRDPLACWRLVRADEADWLLIQTEHHLVHDGWSVAVLWQEVGELYRAWSTGRQPHLPALPIQFSDYAEWQRHRYSGVRRQQARAYWRRQLDGVRPADLAVAGPRPPRQTFVGSALRVEIPAQLYAQLREFSHAEGGSLFATMFAAFAMLLHRYSGEPDICIGSWLANRDQEETENLIGMFVNMVALRSTLTPQVSFRHHVAQVRQTLHGALAHQYAPFDDVVRELNLPRDASRNPLVQHCFSFHDSHFPDFAWPGAQGVFQERHNGSAKFDLNVIVVPGAEQHRNLVGPLRAGERLTLIWEYNTAVLASESAERMLAHYIQMLTAAVAGPDRDAARLSILTDADRAPVAPLSDATRQHSPLLAARDVVEMFRRQVARRPDAVAVRGVDGTLSYSELAHRARSLAGSLRRQGVSPGDRVAVCLPRTSALPVALLGILLAGAAYVPLDPQHPALRHRLVTDDAGVRVIVTQPDLFDVFRGLRHVVASTTVSADIEGRRPDPQSEAYVLFTSGTTGRPKGVAVPHRALTNVVQAIQHLVQLTEDDVLLAVTTIAFDIAALEYFLPLATGGCVVIAPEDAVVNGERLSQLAAASGVTVMQATPLTWRIMVEVGWRPASRFTVLCGGESMPADLARDLAARSTACWNLYGPTETTIWSTAYRVRGDETHVPIGRPLLNTSVRILDDAGELVPVGLPGELSIGGTGVALGYTSATLTAGRFEQGWYRTGDLVRRRPDGDLEFLARGDRQVKLHGYRIELEEIELTLRGHPGVRDCAVELRGDRLVGYVVPQADPVSPEDLAAHLGARLPRYMVPAAFVALPGLPRSANGKVDRAALADSDLPVLAAPAKPSSAPVGPIEEQLAEIWAEILSKRELGAEDDFFANGGHSLLAVLMVSRIRSRMNRELDLEEVFNHPTIRGIASVLAGGDWT